MKKREMTIFGEFKNKTLEKVFLNDEIKRNAKFIGPIIMFFGIIFALFLVSDFMAIKSQRSLMAISVVRAFVLIISSVLAVCISRYKGENYGQFIYYITVYEAVSVLVFLIIMNEYDTLSAMALFSVSVIVLAVYVLPNKLMNIQIITIVFQVLFFLLYVKKIEGLKHYHYLFIAVYGIIFLIFSNINAYVTSYYKRKQYMDSKELLRVSITDSLTGVYNRAKFIKDLQEWVDMSYADPKELSLILCDIDDFKKVNDTYGHLTGDRVLQSIVSVIQCCIRNTDILARWGGEEFIILLPNTDLKQSYGIAQRIRTSIHSNKHSTIDNITCSFGLVSLKENDNIESLVQRADMLLYKAKNTGKNIVICEE